MRQQRPLVLWTLVILVSLLLPGSSSAQNAYRYSIGLMAGFGGTTGSEPSSPGLNEVYLSDDQLDLGFQLLFSMEIQRDTLFGVRIGQLDVELGNDFFLTNPIDSELTYATAVGEYRFSERSYQSGVFLGIGYYALDGQNFFEDDSALGLTLGVDGDFRINDRWSVLVEFSTHYADLDAAQFFVMGHAGLLYHF